MSHESEVEVLEHADISPEDVFLGEAPKKLRELAVAMYKLESPAQHEEYSRLVADYEELVAQLDTATKDNLELRQKYQIDELEALSKEFSRLEGPTVMDPDIV